MDLDDMFRKILDVPPMPNADEPDICVECGCALECLYEAHTIMGVDLPTKRTHCEACCYKRTLRDRMLVHERPYQKPLPRLMKDGSLPPVILDQIKNYREEIAQKVAAKRQKK